MCVFKYHAFIYFLRPPPWYGTDNINHGAIPLLFPFADSPYFSSIPFDLLGNPPCPVIESRPPWSQVTCELTSPFSAPPHSKFPASLLRFPQHPAPPKTTTRSRLPESGTSGNQKVSRNRRKRGEMFDKGHPPLWSLVIHTPELVI
jgi:hypothetical protein